MSDPRIAMVRSNPSLARALLAVLHEVYWSSAGPAVRSQALKAILRCVYYADATLLRVVLKMQVRNTFHERRMLACLYGNGIYIDRLDTLALNCSPGILKNPSSPS